MLNIAIVGTGIIGNSHIKAIQELQDCRLCALCDVNEEVVAELASQHNVPYFLDYKQIPGSVDFYGSFSNVGVVNTIYFVRLSALLSAASIFLAKFSWPTCS